MNRFPSKNLLYYGSAEPLPEQKPLRAGPLSLVYEAGDLRYIRLGEREIVRRMYVAVRDRNWNTVPGALTKVHLEVAANSFRIAYQTEHQEGELDFCWQGAIEGDHRGTIAFSMEGEARSTFWRNRIGFCLLLPIRECAGQQCLVERVDGPPRQGLFPLHVAPEQPVEPFAQLRAIRYGVAPGVWAQIRFAGELFEMEDQRNWTDASYKIFCTPLRLPFPVRIEKGTRISQSLTLKLEGRPPAPGATAQARPLIFALRQGPAVPLPRLGLAASSHGQPLALGELERLRELHLSHLRLDLRLAQPGWEEALRRVWAEAQALGARLEMALHLSSDAARELSSLVDLVRRVKPRVMAWLIFPVGEKTLTRPWIELARQYLTAYDPQIPLGGGTNADFYQLNQFRPPAELMDFVSFSINPQVHAFDTASLVETLEAQAAPVMSGRQYFPGKALAVSPLTLKPRFNPVATGPEPEPAPGQLPPQVDPRQMSLLGAGWTAASLGRLGGSGLEWLTLYQTTGWQGVMETQDGPPLPEKFPSWPGAVFPLYHVLADVGQFAGGQVLPTLSSDPLKIEGLAVRRDGRVRLVVANLSGQAQQIAIQGLGQRVRVRLLDELSAPEAMDHPENFRASAGQEMPTQDGTLTLELLPYACAGLDVG